MNNIFTDLIGIIPTLDNQLQLSPLIPTNWTHFAIENLPYHGTLLTILWDQTGTYYKAANHTPGLSVYSNATLLHTQPSLAPVNISLPFNSTIAASTLSSTAQWDNILANPNAPHGLPNISADYVLSTNGDYSPYEAWKMIDGLLWYDNIPQNYWTQNQSSRPWNTLSITLPRARNLSSVSLAIIDDTAAGGVIKCPAAISVKLRDGSTIAERRPWTGCVGNALNTIAFSAPVSSNASSVNTTTVPVGGGAEVETDYLEIQLADQNGYAYSITEIQIWVPPTLGPRWEAEDALLGTFVGSFEGTAEGMNSSIVDGGVLLGEGGWLEWGGVVAPLSSSSNFSSSGNGSGTGAVSTTVNLTVLARGPGSLDLRINWLDDYQISLSEGNDTQEVVVEVELLVGRNYVTLFQSSGTPWIDAIIVD